MKIGVQAGLGSGHTVLDGDPAPPPPKGHSHNPSPISAHVYCGQTAGWIKMALGTEVGLSYRRHCVRWGPSSPPQKEGKAPNFGPCLLWQNGWIDQDGTWHGGGPQL